MLNKKGSSLIFLILISTMVSTFTIQFAIPFAIAAEEEDFLSGDALIINSDWIETEPVSFNGHDIGDDRKYGRLSIDHGGQGMTEFINHGEVAYDEEEDIHVYMATMTFLESYVVYTDVMIDDAYDHGTGTTSREWLKLKTFRTWFYGYYKDGIQYEEYDVSYKSIRIHSVNTHEYDGNLRIYARVRPNLAVEEGGYMTINGHQFYIPDIRVYLSEAKLVDRRYGVCDDATNLYTYNDDVIEIRKEDLQDLSTPGDGSSTKNGIEDDCGSGWEKDWTGEGTTPEKMTRWGGLHNIRRTYGVTYTSGQVGQAFACTPTVGSVWDQPEDLNDYDEEFEFLVPIRIKPNLFYDKEDFDINHAYLYVDRYKEDWLPEWGLCDMKEVYTESRDRIVGLGVQNIFAMMDFEFEVTMLMAVVPTGEEGEEILEDPEVYQGDIIWDNAIGGTTEAHAPIAQPENWWTDFWEDFDLGLDDFWDRIDDWWDEVFDWWDQWTPEAFMGWWKQFWWVIVLIAIAVVAILGLYLFWPRIARGTAKGYGEYKRQQLDTQQHKQKQHR